MEISEKKDAFEKYYNRFYSQIYKYILKRISNIQDAEDLTIEVFFSVWEKFDSFDEKKASFQTWLYVIVNNKLKNYYRDRKEFEELDELIANDENQDNEIVEANQLQYLREHLYVALAGLSEVQRQIVIYKYFNELNASEIAYLIGFSPGNVRVQLKRALDKIREYFKKNNIRWE